MTQQQAGKLSWKWIVVIVIGLAAVLVGMGVSMARTSTTEYCTSCHEMKPYLDELKKSPHALDANKKPIDCAQCHVPADLGPKYLVVKTVIGMKDMIVHYLGDPENLDRRDMQPMARQFMDDDNCLACHKDLMKDAKGEKAVSEVGKLCHEAYLGKNGGGTKRNCAGCHQNMAHLPRFDMRYAVNAEFAKRLIEAQAKTASN